MNTCEQCRFWEADAKPTGVGFCHRYPPTTVGSTFPRMKKGEWCGEFKLKLELEPCFKCGKPIGKDYKFQMGTRIPIGYVCAKCYREPELKP